jgi:hypothetical protein
MAASWDRLLSGLHLNHVRIHANSLTEAWKALSTDHFLRSVLVVSGQVAEERPFEYQSAACAVQDLYQALAAVFELTWTQDEKTGVTWVHPLSLPYPQILASSIQAPHDQWGLPMQSGILQALEGDGASGVRVKHWGTLFLNTFDYPVDVPSGAYNVRELLNLCCLANPTKTFFVRVQDDQSFITAVNLVSDRKLPVPPGGLFLWDVEVGKQRRLEEPTTEQIIMALANPVAKVRYAARNYLEAGIWRADIDDWLSLGFSAGQILWTCIGITSILVRSEDAIHPASTEAMKRLATVELLAEDEPGLAVMTALDLARLTKEPKALEIVEKRNFTSATVAGITSDACRIAALSAYVREMLRAKTAQALLQALQPLAKMVQPVAPGKLRLDFRLLE